MKPGLDAHLAEQDRARSHLAARGLEHREDRDYLDAAERELKTVRQLRRESGAGRSGIGDGTLASSKS